MTKRRKTTTNKVSFYLFPPLPSHGQQDYYDNPSHAIMHAWAMMMASFFTAALMQCNRGYGQWWPASTSVVTPVAGRPRNTRGKIGHCMQRDASASCQAVMGFVCPPAVRAEEEFGRYRQA
ncbi:hypothetical protein TTHERM_02320960 (macronuclear) [Tetrahymena thermophila SB210]|uniref:Uncharacterized protein n=1 Tax=Tetrahymena thermophila (strain SB210) TaxID=312017 RepID=Q225A8_TETTS|nr:hypothetical protein TTHERM_02320960 [Tetrahymena thermophila SB210]EAR80875.1 hypothetical protein TTHERM_02320960 [Tetrahymena thermophila SB210]|eukprot:XP_001028538.1 hypothetical protein TTHERM_02320960 [Tetrahymena thermophila SB210]